MLHISNDSTLFFSLKVALLPPLWSNNNNFPKWRLSRESGDLIQPWRNLK